MIKQCRRCGVEKPLEDFAKMAASSDGLQSWCRACNTEHHREWARLNPEKVKASRARENLEHRRLVTRFYGARRRGIKITREEFDVAVQVDSCQICGKYIQPGTKAHHLDHDHKTGQFRGVLCHGCNTSLGHFDENLETMRKAIQYLEDALSKYNPTAGPFPPTPGRTGRKKLTDDGRS